MHKREYVLRWLILLKYNNTLSHEKAAPKRSRRFCRRSLTGPQ